MNAKNKEKKVVPNENLPQFMQVQSSIINELQKANEKLQKAFTLEMNCKNQVYGFILQKGYLDEYIIYSRQNPI